MSQAAARPVMLEKVPSAHGSHGVACPASAAKVPAGHWSQLEPAVDEVPAGQEAHEDEVVDPAGEDLPAGHCQWVQLEPAVDQVPAGQEVHELDELDPAGEDFPAGQLVHVEDVVAPVTVDHFPAGQEVHVAVEASASVAIVAPW